MNRRWILVNSVAALSAAWIVVSLLHAELILRIVVPMAAAMIWPAWVSTLASGMRVRNARILREREERQRRTKG